MKKVLFATTALMATASVAAADVNLSGSARFGMQHNSAWATETILESRITLNIDVSTETDGGLELGGRIRLRSNEFTGSNTNGANLYVKSGGFKLTVGNICGAFECMPGIYAGSTGLNGQGWSNLAINTIGAGFFDWDAYSSNGLGADGAEVEYTAGDFKAHLSYGTLGAAAFHRTALTLAYTFGDWTAVLGLQEGDRVGGVGDKTVLTVNGKLGDFGVGIAYADNNGTDKIVLNGKYTMGATTISGYIADEDTAGIDTSYGLTVSYDLGGALLVGGIAEEANAGGTTDTRASAGIKFKF
ncbi:porin [Profundibacter sp.]